MIQLTYNANFITTPFYHFLLFIPLLIFFVDLLIFLGEILLIIRDLKVTVS